MRRRYRSRGFALAAVLAAVFVALAGVAAVEGRYVFGVVALGVALLNSVRAARALMPATADSSPRQGAWTAAALEAASSEWFDAYLVAGVVFVAAVSLFAMWATGSPDAPFIVGLPGAILVSYLARLRGDRG